MKKTILICAAALFSMSSLSSCEKEQMNKIPYDLSQGQLPTEQGAELAALNLSKAVALADTAFAHYFTGETMKMLRYYNPVTHTNETEVGSVWMYTSAIEAVNSIMESLKAMQKQVPELYANNYDRYKEILAKLYDNLEYYAGTYTLTSYTQTREWTVYSVNRANDKGSADVSGVLNVYDDQEWLLKEMIRSYQITGEQKYLEKAEYLTDYVLDGWDCTPDANGDETGGITWGPGYVSKHSCSNGPIVSPLVWLYEIYRGKSDMITYRKVDLNGKRYEVTAKKADYYLEFAKKVYAWQKKYLMDDTGVYYDLISASAGEPQYEEVDGVRYRKGLALTTPSGTRYTYNSGTMLSGCADLYRVTRMSEYLSDVKALSTASFNTFATKDNPREGYYGYPVEGFCPWFNDVLMSGYASAVNYALDAATALNTYQANLDYAWANFQKDGILPINLLVGWSQTTTNNNVESMFTFAYAAEYAVLANYQRKVFE
jgi:hypothetical protein